MQFVKLRASKICHSYDSQYHMVSLFFFSVIVIAFCWSINQNLKSILKHPMLPRLATRWNDYSYC